MKIIIVSNDQGLANSLREILDMEGYDAIAFEDGKSGFEEFGIGVYDLAIVSVSLNSMSGLEFMAASKQRKLKTKVIMVSSSSDEEAKLSCEKMGAYGCLDVPIDLYVLLELVKKAGKE